MRNKVGGALLVGLMAIGVSCVEPVTATPSGPQVVKVSVSGRYGWRAEAVPSKPIHIESANGLIRTVVGAADLVDDDGTRLRVVVDVQALGEGTVGSIAVTNLETGREVATPVAAAPRRADVDATGRWHVDVTGEWGSIYRGSVVPFRIDLTIDTAPVIPGVTTLSCDRAEGTLRVTPGTTDVAAAQTFSMAPDSGLRNCVDADGVLIGDLMFDQFRVEFSTLGCNSPSNVSGIGSAALVWPDGARSTVEVIVAPGGQIITLTTTGGRLAGTTATLRATDPGTPQPTCSSVPQTQLKYLTESVQFAPVQGA